MLEVSCMHAGSFHSWLTCVISDPQVKFVQLEAQTKGAAETVLHGLKVPPSSLCNLLRNIGRTGEAEPLCMPGFGDLVESVAIISANYGNRELTYRAAFRVALSILLAFYVRFPTNPVDALHPPNSYTSN